MRYESRARNEFYTLLGAIYAFVAYLSAFTIEILFIIDLAKRGDAALGIDFLSKAKSQLALACLAIAILYFIIFLSSLVLIVALIMRSNMCIIIWLTIKMVLYLPEFGLVVYVAIYEWGIDSRNGQTELIFYAIRAVLDVIFIFKGHQLYKDWKFEKSFFRFDATRFNGYDSPYFIGDSLSTTINPVFSSPHFPSLTLQADRYDHVRQLESVPPANRLSIAKSNFVRDDLTECADCDINHRHYRIGHHPSHRNNNNQYGCDIISANQKHQSVMDPAYMNDYYLEQDYDNRTQGNVVPKVPGMTYSTQSLDRRHLKDNTELTLPEQVILRPLNHRPFEYLDRPGSTANLQSQQREISTVPAAQMTLMNNNSTSSFSRGSDQHLYLGRSNFDRHNRPFSYLSEANPLHPHYNSRSRSPTQVDNYNRR